MIRELALKNRSYRRFYGEKKIDEKTLRELVDKEYTVCGKQTAASIPSCV